MLSDVSSSMPIDSELLTVFFNKIQDRLPKYILSEHESQVSEALEYINTSLSSLHISLNGVPKNNFDTIFKEKIQKIADEIDKRVEPPLCLHELTPSWHEIISVRDNYKSIFNDIEQMRGQIEPIQSNLLKSENIIQSPTLNGSGDIWKNKAKKQLRKMYEDFNLRSLQVSNKSSWQDIYKWAKNTYNAIEQAQYHIGLETSHVGLNKCLNLCFNPESLIQSRGNGKMFADKDCNTIVLRSFPKNNQINIWQHEYAHTLDNRVGIKLAKEQLPQSQINSCMFLSQIEMDRQLSNTTMVLSRDPELRNAQQWVVEAISDAVCGSSSESLKEHQKKCSDEFSKILAEKFIIQCIGEENWLILYDHSKKAVLSSSVILKFVDSIAENIYKNGVKSFIFNFEHSSESKEMFNTVMKEATSHINADWMCVNFAKNFSEKLSSMSWDYLSIMKTYYYSHTNNQRYFSKSKTAIAASSHSLNYVSPYHTRTLELFARSCEDLQRPLIVSTPEYFIKKEKVNINTAKFLNPTLNRNERKVFINTIHSFVKALGMTVQCDIESLPALKEIIINEPITTYSSMSGNEEIAQQLLEKLKKATNKIG